MPKNIEKKYFENSKSINVMNSAIFNDWINNEFEITRDVFEERHLLLRDNKKFLLNKIGKQSFCITDSQRRRVYVWKFKLENLGEYWILTAPERGTSFEFSLFENVSELDFFESLKKHLRNIFSLTTL